jgi:DNA-binding response OmpR family regulator
MSGQEFVTAYRQMPSHDAPLIVVSAVNDGRRIAADLGAAAYLPKPFSIEQLTQAVRRVTAIPGVARPSKRTPARKAEAHATPANRGQGHQQARPTTKRLVPMRTDRETQSSPACR